MALDGAQQAAALRLLARSAGDLRDSALRIEGDQSKHFIYESRSRPFWAGFAREAEDEAGFSGFIGSEMRLVELRRAPSAAFVHRMELTPVTDASRLALAEQVLEGVRERAVFGLQQSQENLAVAWLANGEYRVTRFDVSEPGQPSRLGEEAHPTLAAAVVAMTTTGYERHVAKRYLMPYLGTSFMAQQVLAEVAEARRGNHPGFAGLTDNVGNGDALLQQALVTFGDRVMEVVTEWDTRPELYSVASGLSPERVQGLASHLESLSAREAKRTSIPHKEEKEAVKQRWIDLSAHGIYLGDQRMADGKQRLVLLDMNDRADAARLRDIGFVAVGGSPRYERGIYCMRGDDQRLRPKALAAAFGIDECPLVEVEVAEIQRVFGERILEKFDSNIHALVLRSRELGYNKGGKVVFESAAGRFVRSRNGGEVVTEDSKQAASLSKSDFLRAESAADVRDCAEGFFQQVRNGAKTNWNDLLQFASVIYSLPQLEDPSDEQMFALQEALEAAAYRVFLAEAEEQGPNAKAFQRAQELYYGLPVSRMRTGESVALQQFSTPLPMSVVTQHLLIGNDDPTGRVVLEPTAGNAGLTCALPAEMQRCAVELDRKRYEALAEQPGIHALHGDAVQLRFRDAFELVDGFDYVIANPPFGKMPVAREFDKLKNVSKIDHYIALRALEDRRSNGRAVFILGADSPMSDGTISGASKPFYNYVFDHYEVHGLTEVDGRLYSRQGSAYNVRMLVVGNRRAMPLEKSVPERLPIVTSYDELWSWAEHTISLYGPSLPEPEATADDEIQISIGDIEPQRALLDALAPAIARRPGPSPELQAAPQGGKSPVIEAAPQVQPWEMTNEEWDRARAATRGGAGGTMNASVAAARLERMQFLTFGVRDADKRTLELARDSKIQLSREALEEVMSRMGRSVSHQEVVEKAIAEGHPVPPSVLADYPELSEMEEIAPPAPVIERRVNEFQVPYQAASKIRPATAMIPINMAGATYAALNALEAKHGPIDDYVGSRLQFSRAELGRYFGPEQIDAIGLGILAVENDRGATNADQTGLGKGRFGAAMLRYAKLNGKLPVFITIKPELFTDIFRDINDIGSGHLFEKVFIFNDGENIKRFGTEKEVLYPATHPTDRKAAIAAGAVADDTDLVLATYSQFQRAQHKNPKAQLLLSLIEKGAVLNLDEAHVASGASNLGATIQDAVTNSDAVVYLSATPFKGIANFAVYSKIFPRSVDLLALPDTLKAGGEALMEAISTNMARDGVLIRREHDFSQLTFHTHAPSKARQAQNTDLANRLSEILGRMSFLAGDVGKVVSVLNRQYTEDWGKIPMQDRQGGRMQATSMNFGSRLYGINRQFLLGVSIDDAAEVALNALANGRKPGFAVENTGEALLRAVISRRLGLESVEEELDELKELGASASPEQVTRREVLAARMHESLQNVVLDDLPQFRELLELMLDRLATIKVVGRYGDVTTTTPESDEWHEASEAVRKQIHDFPDLPLSPIDMLRKRLVDRGYSMGEVSGRKVSLHAMDGDATRWAVKFHDKADAVATVAGYQSGRLDAIVITRSGSTGISLHATNRFANSDARQREFVVLQRAANIAEFLQWMGRFNRVGQTSSPIISTLDSGLPAESRLIMMHNAKLRKLSANTTSNRENSDLSAQELDLLNDVGDRIALDWLFENPDIASKLDIALPTGEENDYRATEAPYINKLMGRLMMVPVDRQKAILKELSQRFVDRVEELEQRGINPFKVDVYEWGATVVKTEELQTGMLGEAESSFDEPVTMVTLNYEQVVYPVRSSKLAEMAEVGRFHFRNHPIVHEGGLSKHKATLQAGREEFLCDNVPERLREGLR